MNSTTRLVVQFLVLICCAACFSFGCASTHTVDVVNDPAVLETFNHNMDGCLVTVTLHSGQQIYADNVSARSDSTKFHELNGRGGVIVPTKSISHIRWNDHVVGIGRGVIFGAVLGAISTAVFRPMFPAGVGGGEQSLSIAGGAIIGGALGVWPGFVMGQETIYEITGDSARSSE